MRIFQNVSVGALDAQGGRTWLVTFAAVMGNVPQLIVVSSALTGLGNNVVVSTVTGGNMLSGTYLVSYGGVTSGNIAYGASAADLTLALESMGPIPTVNVVRTGPDNQGGYQWTVTFTSTVNSGSLNLMVATSALGGSGARVAVSRLVAGNQVSGTFQLSYKNLAGLNSTTAPIAYNASATDVQTALEAIASIPDGSLYVYRCAALRCYTVVYVLK